MTLTTWVQSGKDVVPDLIEALQDQDRLVRMSAAIALGEIAPTVEDVAAREAMVVHIAATLEAVLKELFPTRETCHHRGYDPHSSIFNIPMRDRNHAP